MHTHTISLVSEEEYLVGGGGNGLGMRVGKRRGYVALWRALRWAGLRCRSAACSSAGISTLTGGRCVNTTGIYRAERRLRPGWQGAARRCPA